MFQNQQDPKTRLTQDPYNRGRAIALRLARDGYSVCINDIPSSSTEINTLVNEINETTLPLPIPARNPIKRPRAIGIAADVTSSTAVADMVTETVSSLGPLTLMVANAGIATVQPALSVSEKDIDNIFGVNFKGAFNCYSQAARQMIAQGDPDMSAGVNRYKIVGCASIAGFKGLPTLGIYSASKFAIRGLTQSLAGEMARHEITVNAYAPGIVGTEMWDEVDETMGQLEGRAKGESLKLYSKEIALGRTGVPDDVAGLVGGFLASKDSDYVTGQTILVDGGMLFT